MAANPFIGFGVSVNKVATARSTNRGRLQQRCSSFNQRGPSVDEGVTMSCCKEVPLDLASEVCRRPPNGVGGGYLKALWPELFWRREDGLSNGLPG
jgi:hypothetical protein